PRPTNPTSWKFDFGNGVVANGYKRVTAQNIYNRETGFGFEPGSQTYFSVAVPEGNYKVTATLGRADGDSQTTVKAELRRLMFENIETKAGKFVPRTFTVNVRTPQIAGGGEVKLKDREKTTEAWAWDEKLTLEFSGAHPAVSAIEITRADNLPTIYLLG